MKQQRLLNTIIGGSYQADEKIAGNTYTQNMYTENVESTKEYTRSILRSVEGERCVLDFDRGCLGMITASNGFIYGIFGSDLCKITKARDKDGFRYFKEVLWSYQSGIDIERVCFTETGGINSHIVWCDGTENVYAYPLEPEKAELSVPLVFGTPVRVYKTADQIHYAKGDEHVRPTMIVSLNGVLIINDPETDTFYYTDPYILGGTNYSRQVYDLKDGRDVQYKNGTYEVLTKDVMITDVDPTSKSSYLWLDRYSKPHFQTAEASADKIVGMAVSDDYLFIFGEKSLQIYTQQVSNDAQGFSSVVLNSAGRNLRNIGARSAESIVVLNGSVYFLGSSDRGERSIWATNGGNPTRISTNAMERDVEGEYIDNARAFGYVTNGHAFYCLTMAGKTFVYDTSTGEWHNRTTLDENFKEIEWFPHFCVTAFGDTYLSSPDVKALVLLDKQKFTNYLGHSIIKQRVAPIVVNDFSPFIINDISLEWNVGTSKDINDEQNAKNPVVMLAVALDGNVYGSEMWGRGGPIGHYGARTTWFGIGAGRLFSLKFTISDPVNVTITGSKINFTPLSRF